MFASTSLFLDALRLSAACVVFLSHLTEHQRNHVLPWVPWGREAVAVFFVISGFVIAYVVASREDAPKDYLIARLGRLYSVVLPALLLTVVADTIGRTADPAIYRDIPDNLPLFRIAINALFLQENWNFTVSPLSDGPFWSLGYEFWYYLVFGAWIFLRGVRRVVAVTLVCLMAGPRIVAALPIWLMGVGAYRMTSVPLVSGTVRRALLIVAVAALGWFLVAGNPMSSVTAAILARYPDQTVHVGGFPLFLGGTTRIAEDYFLGFVIAGLLVGVARTDAIDLTSRSARAIRYLAGSTFSIYLFHLPLLLLFWSVFHVDGRSAAPLVAVGMLVLMVCIALSHGTERRVARYRSGIQALIARIGPRRNLPSRPDDA